MPDAEDAADFDAFYLGLVRPLVRQTFLLAGDLSEAEDVVAEAFERAWLRWPTVRELDSPEAWVRTVARRLAVSRWRKVRTAAVAWGRHGASHDVPELSPESSTTPATSGESSSILPPLDAAAHGGQARTLPTRRTAGVAGGVSGACADIQQPTAPNLRRQRPIHRCRCRLITPT